jgi:hypothetical protein
MIHRRAFQFVPGRPRAFLQFLARFLTYNWRSAGPVPATKGRQRSTRRRPPKYNCPTTPIHSQFHSQKILACRAAARSVFPNHQPAFTFATTRHPSLSASSEGWRRGRDSNPRRALARSGFQDRRDRPLCHLSVRRLACRAAARRSFLPASVFAPSEGWHGRRDLNPQPTVLETATLPIELLPYPPNLVCLSDKKGAAGFIPALQNLKTALSNDFRHATGANRATAFANRKTLAFFHGHRRDDTRFPPRRCRRASPFRRPAPVSPCR